MLALRSTALLAAAAVLCAVLAGCGAGTALDSEEWPRGGAEKPALGDLAGAWRISGESAALVRAKGGYPEFAAMITLKEDGGFLMRQMPDCVFGDGFEAGSRALLDGEGTWSLAESQERWVVSVSDRIGHRTFEVGLWNRRAPYRLWLSVGDPDSGDYLFFDRQ